jgi:phosphate transport system substrate-binding protein
MRAAPVPGISAVAGALALLALAPGAASAEMIRIGGAGAALATVQALGEQLAARHAGYQALILPSLGSEGGLRALSLGMIDLALATRSLRPEEAAAGAHEAACLRTPAGAEAAGSRLVLREGDDHRVVIVAARADAESTPDPRSLRVCLVLPASPSPAAARLVAYARSAEGRAALHGLGAVPEE